jgi:hypothetical protein
MPIALIETKILQDAIQMRYADHLDPQKVSEWIEFRVRLADLPHPIQQGRETRLLGDPDDQFVSEVRLAALRRVRDVVSEENQRLLNLIGRIR